jgi:hypothetical protein
LRAAISVCKKPAGLRHALTDGNHVVSCAGSAARKDVPEKFADAAEIMNRRTAASR